MARREHWGACYVTKTPFPSWPPDAWPYPTMWGAIAALDPFNRPDGHVQLCDVSGRIARWEDR